MKKKYIMEEWKQILGYEGYYEISNFGNVRSMKRCVTYQNGVTVRYKSKERKPSISDYRIIALSKDGLIKLCKISRLVAIHFIETDNKRTIVNHKDYNKHNDHYSNLEWVNNSENIIHSNIRNKKSQTGIFYDSNRKKWAAYIYRNSKNIFVGRFNTESEAIEKQKQRFNEINKGKY